MAKTTMSTEEFIGRLDAALDLLETLRAEELERTRLLQTVKTRALEQEHHRLAVELGAEHPRVKQLASRLAYRTRMMADLEEETARARIKVPALEADTWMVHGVVLDKNRKGKPGLTVGLFDAAGKWRREFGYACTDERGYFAIIYPQTGKARGEVSGAQPLYLHVSDQNYKTLLQDTAPLHPAIGQVYYRRLILPDKPVVCVGPQPDSGDEAPIPGNVWIVQGRVVDESGTGVDGLTVTIYDRDLLFDDRLGSTATRNGGYYEIHYRTEDFRDLIEARPDLYVQVMDAQGRKLCPHPATTRFEAGRREIINLTVKKAK
uniref:Carboxypeptidase regulatory-like domain-containing protein n=1 Tax=Desulfobacca acetoxidans TaxID=60893 RepID=A0A7V4LDQ5_9BACT